MKLFAIPHDAPFKTWYGLIATCGGLGYAAKAPGTVGSALAFIIILAIGHVPLWAVLAVCALGVVASDKYAAAVGRDDPQEIVIDEVAGMFVASYGLDPTLGFVTFFLFRIIDILKPFPVNAAERLKGGWGIMADDIVGGVIVNLLLRALILIFLKI